MEIIVNSNIKKEIDDSLNRIFSTILGQVCVAIFSNTHLNHPFRCLYSSNKEYAQGEIISLYKIDSLVRILCEKSKVLAQTELHQLYNHSEKDEICFILEWEDHIKKIFIFNIEQTLDLNINEFIEKINSEKEAMRIIFQKVYFTHESQWGGK